MLPKYREPKKSRANFGRSFNQMLNDELITRKFSARHRVITENDKHFQRKMKWNIKFYKKQSDFSSRVTCFVFVVIFVARVSFILFTSSSMTLTIIHKKSTKKWPKWRTLLCSQMLFFSTFFSAELAHTIESSSNYEVLLCMAQHEAHDLHA